MSVIERILVLLGVVFILEKLAPYLQRILRDKLTATDDIPLLGLPRKSGQKIKGTAVICGGSIAGLLSARVCSDHFEKVIIVEPEAWVTTEEGQHDRHREAYYIPESPLPKRSRVAQYNHIHIFQIFTTVALRQLFPDFDEVMECAGGRFYPLVYHYHILGIPFLGPYAKAMDGIPTAMHATRPAYETGLRKLVLSHCSNVEYLVGSVTGLVPHKSENRIASVLVRRRSSEDETATEIPATLVIDCTGPARGGLRWLKDAGFQPAPPPGSGEKPLSFEDLKVSYDPKVAYSTSEYHIPPSLREELKEICLPLDFENIGVLYTNIATPYKDGNIVSIQRREDDYMQFMCGAADYRGRITSVDDIRKYYSQIPVVRPFPAWLFPLLDFLEKHEVPATYVHNRSPAPQYVQYFRATQLPPNFIALGDSVLQLNPIRGQGCTSACLDAVTLNALLSRTTPIPSQDTRGESTLPVDFARKFFSVQSGRSGGQWQARKTDDYAWPSTVPTPGDDPNSRASLVQGWLSVKFLELATKDPQFAWDFLHVEHYLSPPTDLFTPKTLAKIVWLHITQTLGF